MKNWRLSGFYVGMALFSGIAGCADMKTAEGELEQSTQAVVGVDEFLYLRCNATGWGVDSTTRLTASGQAGIFALEYNVGSESMVTNGDQCVVTRTNSASGWGSANATFGAANAGVVTAPNTWSIGVVNSAPATIKYPALGRYRASVNWTAKTVAITTVSTTPPAAYYYLRCNATTWNIAGTNRFLTTQSGLALTYSVSQSWMVTGGDQCIVTRTNQLDGWGTTQVALGTATATTLVVSAASGVNATLVSAGQQFTIRYPQVGQYVATFNPATGQLGIAPPPPSVPETGLHGVVESLGGTRVRVTYDFQTPAQLQDFVSTDLYNTSVSLVNGRLLVSKIGTAEGVNAATLIKGFKVDSMRYQAQLEAGDHINVYVGAVWDGNWNPARGYGAVHRPDGRRFVMNSNEMPTSVTSPVVPGTLYSGRIDTTEQGITWTLDGDAQDVAFPYYGGTTRTVVLGGYASTIAFDNIVLEGTVEGFESDGTATNPNVNHGTVVNLPDGRVRITYDFSDAQQKYDFIVNSSGTRRELHGGRLIVGHASDASDLKVALYKYNLRIDRLAYRAELLAGSHVNFYLNTIWDGNWAPNVGCAGIHRFDGRIVATNGAVSVTADTTPVAPRTAYVGEVLLSASGMDWTVNGGMVSLASPCYAGTDGTLGIGSYGADVAFDEIVIEGQLQ
jgi:acylphosphatase